MFEWLLLTVSKSRLSLWGWSALSATCCRGAGNGFSSAVLLALRSSPFHVTAGVCGQRWQDRFSSVICYSNVPVWLPSGCPDCPVPHMSLPVNYGTPLLLLKPQMQHMALHCKPQTHLLSLRDLFTTKAASGYKGWPRHLTCPRMSHVTMRMGSPTVSKI